MSNLLQPRCPRCHKGALFSSLLKITARCPECGLSFEDNNAGDGPTYFTILFLGIGVTVLASIVEYKWQPPLWVHAALWVPFIMLGSIFCLRFFKSVLISLEYRHGKLKD